jgi:hypothetical protein
VRGSLTATRKRALKCDRAESIDPRMGQPTGVDPVARSSRNPMKRSAGANSRNAYAGSRAYLSAPSMSSGSFTRRDSHCPEMAAWWRGWPLRDNDDETIPIAPGSQGSQACPPCGMTHLPGLTPPWIGPSVLPVADSSTTIGSMVWRLPNAARAPGGWASCCSGRGSAPPLAGVGARWRWQRGRGAT